MVIRVQNSGYPYGVKTKYINNREIETVMLNGKRILGHSDYPPTYDLEWDFVAAWASWQLPAGWIGTNIDITQDWVTSTSLINMGQLENPNYWNFWWTNIQDIKIECNVYMPIADFTLMSTNFWTGWGNINKQSYRQPGEYYLKWQSWTSSLQIVWPDWLYEESRFNILSNFNTIKFWIYYPSLIKNISVKIWKRPVITNKSDLFANYGIDQSIRLDIEDFPQWWNLDLPQEITLDSLSHQNMAATAMLHPNSIHWEDEHHYFEGPVTVYANYWWYKDSVSFTPLSWFQLPTFSDSHWILWSWITLTWDAISTNTYWWNSYAELQYSMNNSTWWNHWISFDSNSPGIISMTDYKPLCTVEIWSWNTKLRTTEYRSWLENEYIGWEWPIEKNIDWGWWEPALWGIEVENILMEEWFQWWNKIRIYPQPWFNTLCWGDYVWTLQWILFT